MPLILLLLVGIGLCGPLILSTENNEGAFSIKKAGSKVCFVGRIDNGRDYDALVGVLGRGFFRIYSDMEDYSYTVESVDGRCIAGITTFARGGMDIALVELGGKEPRILKTLGGPGEDMLWFLKRVRRGFLLVGGVKEKDWDILVVKLKSDLSVEWSLRAGTDKHEYAYGAVEYGGRYYVVGRSNFRGNWDGFIIQLTPEGKLTMSRLVGSDSKDYLRFVGIFKGSILAVGRSEVRGDSDAWIFSEDGSFLYDGGEFDYGRVFVPWEGGIALMGDSYAEGQSDGMLLLLNDKLKVLRGYAIGGGNVESVRFLTEEGWFAGYSYSFSLDNDILLGNIGDLCPGIIREKSFKRFRAPVKVFPYPLKRRPYVIEEVGLKLKVDKVQLERIDPCSGVDEGLDPVG